jgi:hypothetical protein
MFHDEWYGQLKELRDTTLGPAPRGLATHEQLDYIVTLYPADDGNVLDIPARNLNYKFLVAEWLWVMFGHADVASIAQYNGVMRRFSDDGVFLTGAYGPHVSGGIHTVLRKLKEDPMTRQAVIQIPRPQIRTKDEPCTLSLQFILRNHELNCIATMRSSDIWLGMPYDVFTFTQIQNCLAGALGVERGFFSLHAGSSHLYALDDAHADKVLDRPNHYARNQWTLYSPALPGLPPSWLDDVFRTQRAAWIPSDAEEPWLSYAHAMCSPSWGEARECLVSISELAQTRF